MPATFYSMRLCPLSGRTSLGMGGISVFGVSPVLKHAPRVERSPRSSFYEVMPIFGTHLPWDGGDRRFRRIPCPKTCSACRSGSGGAGMLVGSGGFGIVGWVLGARDALPRSVLTLVGLGGVTVSPRSVLTRAVCRSGSGGICSLFYEVMPVFGIYLPWDGGDHCCRCIPRPKTLEVSVRF